MVLYAQRDKISPKKRPFPYLTMGILPPLLPTSMDLPFPSLIYYGIGYAPREGEKGIHGRSSKRPTVGRLDDLQ